MTKENTNVILATQFFEGVKTVDCVAMTVILTASSVSDLRNYQIPNYLILLGWLSGLAFRFYNNGLSGTGAGLSCIVISILLLWPLFLFRAIGAGDVKLLSVISCFYGLAFLGRAGVIFLLLAGILSLIQSLRKGLLINRFRYFIRYIFYDRLSAYYEPERDGREVTIPLAPLLAIAYYLVYLSR